MWRIAARTEKILSLKEFYKRQLKKENSEYPVHSEVICSTVANQEYVTFVMLFGRVGFYDC